jgi:hypothetical protein
MLRKARCYYIDFTLTLGNTDAISKPAKYQQPSLFGVGQKMRIGRCQMRSSVGMRRLEELKTCRGNPFGARPTTVAATPETSTCVPRIGAAPKRLCQYPYPSTTVGWPPGSSASFGRMNRPNAGLISRAVKKFEEIKLRAQYSVMPFAVFSEELIALAKISVDEANCLRTSRNSGCEKPRARKGKPFS